MESDTSLTAATVSNCLLRFSKSSAPNGCSPRLVAIRELGGREREQLGSPFPARLLLVSHRPESIGAAPSGSASAVPLVSRCRVEVHPDRVDISLCRHRLAKKLPADRLT